MPFPVLGSNSAVAGYEIENSARFDNAGGSSLGTTFGTATNSKKFTLSFWYKISSGTISGGRTVFGGRSGFENIFIHEDTIRMDWNNASSGTVNWAPKIRDQSAWYHFVIAQDTSQSTDSERIKFYINGVQAGIRGGVTLNYPAQNLESGYNVSGVDFFLSSYNGTAGEVNAYYADVYFVDGQQYAPTVFGEYNDNGVWIPKEAKDDVSFGNNGFFLEFKQTGTGTNSSGIGADTSGNNNHLSVLGLDAQDITTDTPTNNFATFNPLILGTGFNPTFSEGNTKVVVDSGGKHGGYSSIGIASGKWYAEFKCVTTIVSVLGIVNDPAEQVRSLGKPGEGANDVGYLSNNGNKLINDVGSTHGATYTNNDIVMVALDLDNNNVYFGTNGNWADGSGSNNQSSPTSAISITDPASTPTGFYFFGTGDNDGGGSGGWEANFGNAPFSISSGNSDANGYGNFEYAVPSGYYALCTKNLAEYG
jgi:hypothetical protein